MTEETKNNTKLILNICLSYGSRGEIINACQSIATDVQHGRMSPQDINETHISQKLLTANCPDPDLVIRTSGEYRLSNFLLWQLAYSEMFFVEKNWPELTKQDLVRIINSFAIDRKRRYGK
jgi:undecaprenyl diphosphate synthase